jgi:hypothetical protein
MIVNDSRLVVVVAAGAAVVVVVVDWSLVMAVGGGGGWRWWWWWLMSDFVVQRGSPKIIIYSQGQGLGITLGAPQTLLTRAPLWLSTGLFFWTPSKDQFSARENADSPINNI